MRVNMWENSGFESNMMALFYMYLFSPSLNEHGWMQDIERDSIRNPGYIKRMSWPGSAFWSIPGFRLNIGGSLQSYQTMVLHVFLPSYTSMIVHLVLLVFKPYFFSHPNFSNSFQGVFAIIHKKRIRNFSYVTILNGLSRKGWLKFAAIVSKCRKEETLVMVLVLRILFQP